MEPIPVDVSDEHYFGRRFCNVDGSSPDISRDRVSGALSCNLNTFYEDRPQEDLSVDFLWSQGVNHRRKAAIVQAVTRITNAQGQPVLGWVVARADMLCEADGVRAIKMTPQNDNRRHAHLCKMVEILPSDPPAVIRKKARLVARTLMELLNQPGCCEYLLVVSAGPSDSGPTHRPT